MANNGFTFFLCCSRFPFLLVNASLLSLFFFLFLFCLRVYPSWPAHLPHSLSRLGKRSRRRMSNWMESVNRNNIISIVTVCISLSTNFIEKDKSSGKALWEWRQWKATKMSTVGTERERENPSHRLICLYLTAECHLKYPLKMSCSELGGGGISSLFLRVLAEPNCVYLSILVAFHLLLISFQTN